MQKLLFNDYFGSKVEYLDLHHLEDKTSSPSNTSDKINYTIENYEKHPSICNMKRKFKGISKFSFRPASVEEVNNIIQDLKTNKADGGEILSKILKEWEFNFDVLSKFVNNKMSKLKKPKLGNVTPVFKK